MSEIPQCQHGFLMRHDLGPETWWQCEQGCDFLYRLHYSPQAEMKCLICAHVKPWGVFDSATGAAVCIYCRDAARLGAEQRSSNGVPWGASSAAMHLSETIANHFGHDCEQSGCGENEDEDTCEYAYVESKLQDLLRDVFAHHDASAERKS